MTLTELELHNFGVYRGLHRISLAPDSGRPIVLFGGLNGAGKTTLLEGVLLALYGKRTLTTKREGLAYDDYLRRCIHHSVPASEGASVGLRFTLRVAGELRTVRISRVWHEASSGIREVQEVHEGNAGSENLNTQLTARWDEHVEGVVPLGVAPLFFFDGDRIEGLADLANSGELIRTAVHGLLGLDLIDRLSVDLQILERRKFASMTKSEDRESFKMAEQLAQRAESEYSGARERVRRLEAKSDQIDTRASKVEERFKREGGELYTQRAALEARLSQLRDAARSLEYEMRTAASGIAPLLLVQPLLEEIQAEDLADQNKAVSTALLDMLEQRDRSLMRFAEVTAPSEIALVRAISEYLEVDRSKRRSDLASAEVFGLSRDSRVRLSALVDGQLDEVLEELRGQCAEFAVLVEEVDETERTIAGIPEEDAIRPLVTELGQARSAQTEMKRLLAQAREEGDYLFRQAEMAKRRLANEHKKAIDRKWHSSSARRVVTFSSRSREQLAAFRKQVLVRNLTRIQHLVLESFQQLLRKTGMVQGLEIDPDTLTVTLYGTGGHTLHPDRLSAGERQLLAVSLLWGLARASRRVIPTIVDTPLGRLDSVHRQHLVTRYFPYASHQVLLLSTDEEIDGPYLDALSGHIGQSYHLRYDDTLKATAIEKGYFRQEAFA